MYGALRDTSDDGSVFVSVQPTSVTINLFAVCVHITSTVLTECGILEPTFVLPVQAISKRPYKVPFTIWTPVKYKPFHFCCERRNILCYHKNVDLSVMQISCVRAKAQLAFHLSLACAQRAFLKRLPSLLKCFSLHDIWIPHNLKQNTK